MLTKTSRLLAASAAAALAVAGPLGISASATTPSVTVVASGLDNPRGLAWAHGQLYVVQSGHGGTDCPAGAVGAEGGPLCVGTTGSLGVLKQGVVTPVLDHLISLADVPGGSGAVGLAGVTGTKSGLKLIFNESVVGTITGLPKGDVLTTADSTAARQQLGRLASIKSHAVNALSDVGDHDFVWSLVHQDRNAEFPDADPNALAVLGDTTYVADAASNTLVAVRDNGSIYTRAYFPDLGASNSVPTCVAIGPDKNVYVGTLAPAAGPGGGKVYRYKPASNTWSVWRSGFNPVNGCGFDNKGNFYAVEFQANGFNPGPMGNPAGDVVKITPQGVRSVLGAGKLFFPSGFAADRSGNIYVSNWSILTATPAAPGAPTGQLVKIRA